MTEFLRDIEELFNIFVMTRNSDENLKKLIG